MVGGDKDVTKSLLDFGAKLSGGSVKKTGTVAEYAKIRNMPKVYRDDDGTIFDEHGKPIEPKPGLIFIPLPSDEKVH